jgi:type III secretion control protein HpaP
MCSTNVHPRIIPAETGGPDEPPPRPPARRSGFDYAALLRQARVRAERAMLRNSRGNAAHSATDSTDEDAKPPAPPESAVELEPHGDDAATRSSIEDRERRQEANAAPFVAALAQQHARIAGLTQFLVARVADFCSDEAIVEHGNWTIRIRLDPALLPECTLELNLSRFDLMLRFDADQESTRKLICRHADLLRHQLIVLLQQMETPREVCIEVS